MPLVLATTPVLVPLRTLGLILRACPPGERQQQCRQVRDGAARGGSRQESGHTVKLVAVHEGSHSGYGGFA